MIVHNGTPKARIRKEEREPTKGTLKQKVGEPEKLNN